MIARTSALLLVVALAGCQWEGRPDGADANHSASDGYYDADGAPQATPLGGSAGVVEPLDAADFGVYRGAAAPNPTAIPVAPAAEAPAPAPEAE